MWGVAVIKNNMRFSKFADTENSIVSRDIEYKYFSETENCNIHII